MIKPQKQFDKKDYVKNQMAFDALKRNFTFLYPVLREEDYGVDVAIYNGKRAYKKGLLPVCYIEIESKNNWENKEFPKYFPDVQFLAKKQKHIKQNKSVYWVLFNKDCTNATIINFKSIITCELEVVDCKYDNIGKDFFYKIPIDKLTWGIGNLERLIIHDAFEAMNNEHNRFIGVSKD